jgi:hypothetical protein
MEKHFYFRGPSISKVFLFKRTFFLFLRVLLCEGGANQSVLVTRQAAGCAGLDVVHLSWRFVPFSEGVL